MTKLPSQYARAIAVGEPEVTNLPSFAVETFEARGSHDVDRRDLLAEELGEEAEVWLSANARGPWCFIERVHRPRHPREVQRQRLLLFSAVDDAERFAWANRVALVEARLIDMSCEVSRFVIHLQRDVDDRRYDPSQMSLRRALRIFEDLRRRMKHFAAILRRADELQRAEGVRHAMACGWLRLAGEPLSAPLDAEHIVTIGDRRDHARLLATLEEERAAGRYDLSKTEYRHWVRTVHEFIWKARRVRMAWRFMNRDRRAAGLPPQGQPFECPGS